MDINDDKKNTSPKVIAVKDPDFKQIYIDGTYGGLDPTKGQFLLYFDICEPEITEDNLLRETKIERNFFLDLRMSPQTFIGISKWMNVHVEYYEKWMKEQCKEKNKNAAKD